LESGGKNTGRKTDESNHRVERTRKGAPLTQNVRSHHENEKEKTYSGHRSNSDINCSTCNYYIIPIIFTASSISISPWEKALSK